MHVEQIDGLMTQLDTEDSSSAGLAESAVGEVAQIEIHVTSEEVAENIVLFAESAAIDAGIVMERVDEF
ncbi:MAG: hypothetical protein MEQ07_11580 [Aquimonas sp.]|nr:hypothetical protein [Aquimonas sp.]